MSVRIRCSPPVRIRICGDSTLAMSGPGPGRRGGATLADDVECLVLGQRSVDQGVDSHCRADRARRDVRARLEADAAVGGALTGADAELVLERAQDAVAAGEAARRAVADGDDVALDGEKPEAAEAGRAEDLRPVDGHPVADTAQGAFGEVPIAVADSAEDRDERLRLPAVGIDDPVDERRVDLLV